MTKKTTKITASNFPWVEALVLTTRYAQYSKDPSTQVAASLCDESGRIIVGPEVNHFPTGVTESEERLNDRETKYSYMVHAEQGVINRSARIGVATMGKTLVCPWFACSACARSIVDAGIVRVVGLKRPESHSIWGKELAIGDTILEEGGVETIFMDVEIGVTLLRNGQPHYL